MPSIRRVRRHLSFANVVATLALLIALGGTAYAVDRLGSRQVKNNSLRSADLKNRKAVTGRDVRRDSFAANEVREVRLDAGQIARVAGADQELCDPIDATPIPCVETSISLGQAADLLVTAHGAFDSPQGGAGKAGCAIEVDGAERGVLLSPGEAQGGNTSTLATDGFSTSYTTDSPLAAGEHEVSFSCYQLGTTNAEIQDPSISVIAVGAPRP